MNIRPEYRPWLRAVLTPIFIGAFLFPAAGRLDWWAAWIYIALVILMQARIIVTLQRVSPDLLVERSRIGPGTKGWDKVIAPAIGLILPAVLWVVAGLDFRFGWSVPFSPVVRITGFVLATVSAEFIARAMTANRFFANTVRIQSERGHRVVSDGPYAVVRHPGYVGVIVLTLATPLAIGSPFALIPAAACALLLVLRTALEDRTLRAELAGYSEYAKRVPYRLIPGLW